ncbi:MAG: hypothetical protein JNJ61_07725 [Anaerolineae bacterium]|nr:hypothetical protein [Anaerolineae bacterium]
MLKRTLLAALLLVLLAACGSGLNVNVDQQGNLGITIELQEDTVNALIKDAVINSEGGEPILTEINSIDLKPGTITVSGTRTVGGTRVEGSFDLSVATDGGALRARITAVNIPGVTLDSRVIAQANTSLEEAFRQSASQADEVRFDSVEVTDTSLKMVITVLNNTPTG